MNAWVEDYLDHLTVERGLSEHTVAAYRRDLAQYVEFLDNRPPSPELVEAFVTSLGGLAPATMARKTAAVRGLHRYLAAEEIMAGDPTMLLETPRRGRPLPKALSVEEVFELLESCDLSTHLGRRDKALLEFLYGTGARVGEAVALSLHDLDLDEAYVVLTGKGNKQRLVPLGGHAVRALRAWLHDRLEMPPRDDAVFLNSRGRRLSRQGMWGIVRESARRAGLPDDRLSPHVLRHSAATHMVEGGADLRTVQEMLGHASISTTQVYTRVSPRHLQEIYVEAHPRSR